MKVIEEFVRSYINYVKNILLAFSESDDLDTCITYETILKMRIKEYWIDHQYEYLLLAEKLKADDVSLDLFQKKDEIVNMFLEQEIYTQLHIMIKDLKGVHILLSELKEVYAPWTSRVNELLLNDVQNEENNI